MEISIFTNVHESHIYIYIYHITTKMILFTDNTMTLSFYFSFWWELLLCLSNIAIDFWNAHVHQNLSSSNCMNFISTIKSSLVTYWRGTLLVQKQTILTEKTRFHSPGKWLDAEMEIERLMRRAGVYFK